MINKEREILYFVANGCCFVWAVGFAIMYIIGITGFDGYSFDIDSAMEMLMVITLAIASFYSVYLFGRRIVKRTIYLINETRELEAKRKREIMKRRAMIG